MANLNCVSTLPANADTFSAVTWFHYVCRLPWPCNRLHAILHAMHDYSWSRTSFFFSLQYCRKQFWGWTQKWKVLHEMLHHVWPLGSVVLKLHTFVYSGNKIADSPNQSNSHDQRKGKSKGKANRYTVLFYNSNKFCLSSKCMYLHTFIVNVSETRSWTWSTLISDIIIFFVICH